MVGVQLPDGASLGRTGTALDEVDARSRWRRRACEQVVAIAGMSVLDNMRAARQCRRRLRHPRRLGRARQGKGQDIRSIAQTPAARDGRALQDGRGYRARRRRRSRASAMPAASRCRSSSATAASTLAKLQDVTDEADRAGAHPDRDRQPGDDLPRRRAAHRGRGRPRQGREPERRRSATCSRRCPPISARPTSTTSTSSARPCRSMSRPIRSSARGPRTCCTLDVRSQRRQDGADRRAGADRAGPWRRADHPLQPLSLGHDHRRAGAGLQLGPGARR